jgi:Concanavalin A-like lectin/glucanases superfamily
MSRAFNGTTDLIQLPTASALNFNFNSTFSVNCFLKGQGAASFQNIIGNLDTGNNFRGWEFTIGAANNDLTFFLINTFNTHTIQQQSATIGTLTGYTGLGFTYSGSGTAAGVTFYEAGAAIGKAAPTFDNLASNPTTNSIAPRIGARHDGTDPLQSSMMDMTVWNVVLNAGEMQQLQLRGVHPIRIRPNNIVLYMPLDGIASPEPDYSGNAYNGTLTGTTLGIGAAGRTLLSETLYKRNSLG